jgi:ribosomal protein L29
LVGKNSEIEELKRGIDLRNTEIESWQKHVVDLKKELLQVKREVM